MSSKMEIWTDHEITFLPNFSPKIDFSWKKTFYRVATGYTPFNHFRIILNHLYQCDDTLEDHFLPLGVVFSFCLRRFTTFSPLFSKYTVGENPTGFRKKTLFKIKFWTS